MKKIKTWVARKYQEECVKRGLKGSLALFLDPGLGKTTIILEIIRKLLRMKRAKGALVIAPINPLYMTWPDEITTWSNFCHLKYKTLHINENFSKYRDTKIYLINPERLNKIIPALLKMKKEDWPFDILVVDESSKFKETKSARTKMLLKIASKFKYRYILNGTPTGNGYMGLYAQMKIVDNGKALGRTKGAFLNTYFRTVGNPVWFQYELADKHQPKRILKHIKHQAIVLKAEDHIEIPKVTMVPKFIQLPPKAKKIYDQINKEFCATIDKKEIVAETAATMAGLLHQICNGAMYYMQDPTEPYTLAIKRGFHILHKEKVEVLKGLIDEYQDRQILIGYKFQNDKAILEKEFGKKITFFNNAKTKKAKMTIQDKWNAGRIKILAGEITSLGFGLNLQKSSANVVVFYSVTANFEATDQFIRRLQRSGNKEKNIRVHPILCKDHYDHLITWKMLQGRGKSHDKFFDIMRNYQKKTLN